jgi:glycosyltransferase involved in cell wall biosynthesis
VFVNFANLHPFNGGDLIVEAFAELRQSHDARLLIVSGEGLEQPSATQRIRQLGLDAHAATTGVAEDPLQFAARAWALVDASHQDGSAQMTAAAMSIGCPVIVTGSEGGELSSIIDNGRYGLLLPPGDRAKLAQAMGRMLQPDVRTQYSELGQRRVKALSPIASARVLVDFLSNHLGLGE